MLSAIQRLLPASQRLASWLHDAQCMPLPQTTADVLRQVSPTTSVTDTACRDVEAYSNVNAIARYLPFEPRPLFTGTNARAAGNYGPGSRYTYAARAPCRARARHAVLWLPSYTLDGSGSNAATGLFAMSGALAV